MTDKPKMKTRYYYTEYVNHMIRFFLTCPEQLRLDSVRKRADVDNWVSVQAVLHQLSDEDRKRIETVYKTNWNLVAAVNEYCKRTEEDERMVWTLLVKVSTAIARQRGLI